MSTLAATHLATNQRETYYYKVGVTSLCQSQSAGLAFLNSCGWQLLAISLTTFFKEACWGFPVINNYKKKYSTFMHTHRNSDILNFILGGQKYRPPLLSYEMQEIFMKSCLLALYFFFFINEADKMSEILLNEVQHYNIYYSLKTHEVQ